MAELDLLQAMITDLDGYIDRRAQELAAPVIAAAEQSVREARAETAGTQQRGDDVAAELRRRITGLERSLERARDVKPYQDLLGDIWLYIDWRFVTRQLTTPQKELFADAVDRDVMRSQAEDGEEPHPVAERWWRDDA